MAEEMIEVIEVVEAEEDACEFFFRCCSVKKLEISEVYGEQI
jgi:hypothetical protein